jgi:L-ascorbate metabolism protein UlaG (beta-lactamase superfamily)
MYKLVLINHALMKHTFIFLFAGLVLWGSAQQPASDKIETSNGPLFVQPIFHGCLVLSWNNKTIYVDPYGGQKAFAGIKSPDLVLITDIHGDHLNTETLNAIQTGNARFIVPQAVADQLAPELKSKTIILNNGKTITEQGISISAIPMYNLPEDKDSRHTKGRGNGYILNLGGKNIYLSGDTEDIPEMRGLKNIDIAFVCMNLPFTMDINQAASAVLEFKPKIIYPYHYRGKDGLSDTEAFKKLVNEGDPKIDVRLKNWYPEYEK